MPDASDRKLERLAAHLSGWIRDTVAASGGAGCVLGLSGGLDSAVVAGLCVHALPGRALGVIMPCESDPGDAEDARLTASHFGVATATVDLGPVFRELYAQIDRAADKGAGDATPSGRLARANLKPRLRMTTLYGFANLLGYRVVGTGNASERSIGYFTKWGDGGADMMPLGRVTKTRVRELAGHLGVPQHIIDKPPSAGLWAGQTDEAEMGVTYEELDAWLTGTETPNAVIIEQLHDASRHKRELPPLGPAV